MQWFANRWSKWFTVIPLVVTWQASAQRNLARGDAAASVVHLFLAFPQSHDDCSSTLVGFDVCNVSIYGADEPPMRRRGPC
jgi:hypothetical protein